MTNLARHIVDVLVEGLFSDEDMDKFADIASYMFRWEHKPFPSDPAAKDKGNWTLWFRHPKMGGQFYLAIYGNPPEWQSPDRNNVNYSLNVDVPGGGRGAHTRMNSVEVKWTNVEDLKQKFEDFVRGPLTKLADQGRISTPTLVAANRKFQKTISYWGNTTGRATEEEIEQLMNRFDTRDGNDDAITDDPRAKGRETDYKYMTSDDVRFWNTLADEYDARRTQPG